MCEPTTLAYASFALTAVSTYVQYEDSKAAAASQKAMIEDGVAKDRAATQRQYEEINQVAQDDSAERHKQYLIDQARLRAIGAESGLSGATQDRMDTEVANTADQDLATLESNRQRQTQQAASQNLAKNTQARVQLAGIRKPSALAAGLQIAGAGVSTYRDVKYPRKTEP